VKFNHLVCIIRLFLFYYNPNKIRKESVPKFG
jgi:hypothetical protein